MKTGSFILKIHLRYHATTVIHVKHEIEENISILFDLLYLVKYASNQYIFLLNIKKLEISRY